jgi:hypothetical protein
MKKIINRILIFCLFILFFYLGIVLFSNLILCENTHIAVNINKDYHDCDCFKNLKHGYVRDLPLFYDPENTSVMIELYFKTLPYLGEFYNEMSICNCNCDYCLNYKCIVFSVYIFIISVAIIFKFGSNY